MDRSLFASFLGAVLPFVLLIGLAAPTAADFAFVHPGLLHSRSDLERIKNAVAAKQEPIFAGYEVFRNDPHSQASYALRGPREMVGRNPTVGAGDYDSDANAAYQCALMWCITGDRAYAEKSKAIVNAWSATLQSITGRDAVLMAGLGPFKMVNAAEILRYTDAGWSPADIRQTERHFKTVVYPVLEDFALFANGNWDTAAIKTVLAIGVFCDDRAIFERALRYYVHGAGNGRITHYVINEMGQAQESGRDMPHTQLGLGHLGDSSEIAWNQGLDLYGSADNRLLRGFEYTARYNLGEEVPFTETLDRTGQYHHTEIATLGRGQLRAVFEQIYNHYVHRRGIAAPYTQKAAERLRPEGPGLPGADHPGFGTLLFTRPPSPVAARPAGAPASPGALLAEGGSSGNELFWVAAVGAWGYNVKRATRPGGPYTLIARGVASPAYTDRDVTPGRLYHYTVSATSPAGESPNAQETSISAGLPPPWAHRDVGRVSLPGRTQYDGRTFTLEAGGEAIGGASDSFHFAYAPMKGDGTITARIVLPVSSQRAQIGVMMRETLDAAARHASVLLLPRWSAAFVTRSTPGGATSLSGATPLGEPHVAFGRLMEPCWVRLSRSGNTFTGFLSVDGRSWTRVGSADIPLGSAILVGLPACSGLKGVTTTATYDRVRIPAGDPILDAQP